MEKMTYPEGIALMTGLYSKTLQQHSRIKDTGYDSLHIKYPGYRGPGDYQVNLRGKAPTHQEICRYLHNIVKNKTEKYTEIRMLLEDVYRNGTTVLDRHTLRKTDANFLITLIFWMTLQDEINYPQPKGYQGARMPFCRYFEAIYCAEYNAHFSIDDVCQRCDNRGYRPSLYTGLADVPQFYR